MLNLKYRILIIVGLILASAWALYPRNRTIRLRGADGVLRDTSVHVVPLRKGLDLSGGTYLALEVNDSLQSVANKSDAIDRALKTVRSRIEGFGVSETVVQKQGDDRIVVEIPGIQDPERARQLVQEQAFLEFRITDKTQALERALPRLDQVVKDRGLSAATTIGGDTAKSASLKSLQGLLTDTTKKADTAKGKAVAKKVSATDSLKLNAAGAFSTLFQAGGMPGEFFVAADKVPTLERFLADSAVKAAMPVGKDLYPSTDSSVMQG